MHDTLTGITNPGTRSHKSLSNIGAFLRHLSLHNKWKITIWQNCVCAKALSYFVVNNFLFRIDTWKDKDRDKGNLFLLVIPEKYEPIIFNT